MGQEYILAFKDKLGIEGAPTFLIFYEGREKDRMLGYADMETLMAFVSKKLSHLQNYDIEKFT